MTVRYVLTRPDNADNNCYVNLSVTDHSPTVIIAGQRHVLTHLVMTPDAPLPRVELQHAPAPADVQDAELYVPGGAG